MLYYTAIVFFATVENINRFPGSYTQAQIEAAGKQPYKYRNINNPDNFEQFAKRIGAVYINYYFKKDKTFSHKHWLIKYAY